MHIAIIGNGIAGITAARRLRQRRPEVRITVISAESDYFFSRPALMYIYLGHMTLADTQPYERWLWSTERIERKRGLVTRIACGDKRLYFLGGDTMDYDVLILATGSVPYKAGWPGQDLEGVQGLVSLQDLERLERVTPDVAHGVIVGGGLIGVELAEMLHARGIGVTMLVREPAYFHSALPIEEARLVTRVIAHEGIELRLSTELTGIEGHRQGRAVAVTTTDGERIPCELVGLTAGVRPNLSAPRDSTIRSARGIVVDQHFRTSVDDVYAIGDCAELAGDGGSAGRLEQLWYTGRMHGAVVADVICGDFRRYDRGIWFNSAKFFDLEWQTYGYVTPAGRPQFVDGEQHLYWEHADRRHALRLVHRGHALIGVSALGLRLRQRTCERWIAERTPLDRVLAELGRAIFDPELAARHEAAAALAFRERLR